MHVGVYNCRDLPLGLAGIRHIKCKNRFTFASIVTTAVKNTIYSSAHFSTVSGDKTNTFFLSSIY